MLKKLLLALTIFFVVKPGAPYTSYQRHQSSAIIFRFSNHEGMLSFINFIGQNADLQVRYSNSGIDNSGFYFLKYILMGDLNREQYNRIDQRLTANRFTISWEILPSNIN